MVHIRQGVFETNSSSTHSLTICTVEEFEKWKRGELLFDKYNECLAENKFMMNVNIEEVKDNYNNIKSTYWKEWEQLSEEERNQYCKNYIDSKRRQSEDNYRYQKYQDWYDEYNGLEHFTQTYTSPSGDKLIAFGKYGYDG